ncbi:MAG TPA: TatD family hydrolase [Candidatus Hydrogenedentes bacterium]|nr:TatD family hydrolase [Candidatus Hydrogenedentota bacterium]
MRLVDTHCHLQDPRFDEDRETVIHEALEVLDWIMVIGDDLPNSRAGIAMTRNRVYATIGFHPYYATQVNADTLNELRQLAAHPNVMAIGEIGLDYYNEFSPRPAQHAALQRQLELACELRLPAVIHNRQADDDTLALLQPFLDRLPACIIHCFGSDAAFARKCADRGLYISFAGNVTFPKAQPLRDAALAVPPDRLLIETDAPHLAPQIHRRQRCLPQYVLHTARTLAELKNIPLEEFCETITQNAQNAFQIPPATAR